MPTRTRTPTSCRAQPLIRNHYVAIAKVGVVVDTPVHRHRGSPLIDQDWLLDLPQPPTAAVAISDKSAFGPMEALKERGLQGVICSEQRQWEGWNELRPSIGEGPRSARTGGNHEARRHTRVL